ncbi:hypothetical protein UAY_03379 [Enterococcus moraviensis ATCC BAA-383]|uniref:Uncharacterized protein n=1 Tax=Enterococcus moraviensis ATCC BAA-383 TaxID=1158609 RepID=R2QLA9_9ENTE|nr:hypothetical protein [Enterococcus moraviensis]EOH95953.1 hypothetical protein UAY_03379 [Enterococcus moraviensis ATCC BAA-383]EOT66440.1 hypothetical protein I586_02711 [Enterococcus moraviensis ATCC BAA-383]OJG64934.1 hypothetical protein RV09_GL001352 [Enterococcus moraviensis]
MDPKAKWMLLLFMDVLLFILALSINITPLYFLVIILSFYIYKNGNAVLFKEYDERKKQKYEEYKVVQDAAKQAIRKGNLLKKKKELE